MTVITTWWSSIDDDSRKMIVEALLINGAMQLFIALFIYAPTPGDNYEDDEHIPFKVGAVLIAGGIVTLVGLALFLVMGWIMDYRKKKTRTLRYKNADKAERLKMLREDMDDFRKNPNSVII